MARLAAARGDAAEDWAEAVRLLGAAGAAREALGTPLQPSRRAIGEQILTAARARLGDAAFAATWAEGRALSLEEAVEQQLSAPGSRHSAEQGTG
jgi:hypothetical protein